MFKSKAVKMNKKKHNYNIIIGFVLSLWLAVGLMGYWYCSCNKQSAVEKSNSFATYRGFPLPHQGSDAAIYLLHEGFTTAQESSESNIPMKQVCYYWIPQDGIHGGNLTVQEIDPTICTHIVIAGTRIENNTIVPSADDHPRIYSEVVALKKQNADLLVLLCVASGFSALVKDPQAVAEFAFNAKLFLVSHGLDGIDLDWEFPAWPAWQRDPRERRWFTYLVMQLNNALKLAAHPPLMLTIAVGAPQIIIDSSYEVEELAKYVDYVSIMGYDYHMFKSYMPFTGYNAPLSNHPEEIGFLSTLNIQWATKYWLLKGMPKEKLVVGIPTYGRTWKLLSKDWYNVGAPAVDVGMFNGEITYMEACIFIKEGAVRYYDGFSQVPYIVRDTDWVSFEDPKSIRAKAQWIKDMGVAGVMTWNLNSDDWPGLCSGKKYELHSIIRDIIR